MNLHCILGPAGSGKTHFINSKILDDPSFGYRTATTGIAALNLGELPGNPTPTTINHALGFFNAESLLRKYNKGGITFALKNISYKCKNLIIDEVSLLSSSVLDLIVLSIKHFNQKFNKNMGLYIIGDLGQLPCVNGQPFFKAKCFPEFKVTHLTEVKRQSNLEFIQALHYIRRGEASKAYDFFKHNVNFINSPLTSFRGTTFFATNNQVDIFNKRCLNRLLGEPKTYKCKLEGELHPSWKSIPQFLTVKPGCIIQLLYNDFASGFANGDTAIVNELWNNSMYISLLRTNKQLLLKPRKLENTPLTSSGYAGKSIGTLHFIHARLAYAITIHRSQSLTLDSCQLDLTSNSDFIRRQSGMLYTALSRVRTPDKLYVVGTPDDIVSHCYVDPSFLPFIK